MKLIACLFALVSVASAGYLSAPVAYPLPLSHAYSTSTVIKTPAVAYHAAPLIVKAPVATSYQSFTKVDKPAVHLSYAPVPVATVVKPLTYHSLDYGHSYGHGYGNGYGYGGGLDYDYGLQSHFYRR